MVSIEILAVGNELLNGRTLDTNTHWMCKQLYPMVGMAKRKTTIPDIMEEIVSSVREILGRGPNWLLICGGLGPTFDDITSEALARALHKEYTLNPTALKMLEEFYSKKGIPITELRSTPRFKMAKTPKGAKIIKNYVGAAPGFLIEYHETKIVVLPGVPKELKAMFRKDVLDKIKQSLRAQKVREVLTLEARGIWESDIAKGVEEVMKEFPGVYIKSNPLVNSKGASRLKFDLFVESSDVDTAKAMARGAIARLREYVKKTKGVVTRER
jgi:nicotinamide-nucleotide amidase